MRTRAIEIRYKKMARGMSLSVYVYGQMLEPRIAIKRQNGRSTTSGPCSHIEGERVESSSMVWLHSVSHE
jgi:hypothetical protein